jgi:hypothetical protein
MTRSEARKELKAQIKANESKAAYFVTPIWEHCTYGLKKSQVEWQITENCEIYNSMIQWADCCMWGYEDNGKTSVGVEEYLNAYNH